MKKLITALAVSGLGLLATHSAHAATPFGCQAAPTPVVSLNYGSRYQDNDSSRSAVDKVSNAEVNKALAPVEDFIRVLAKDANAALKHQDSHTADCVVNQLAIWARADALSDLRSFTANLSVGARYAALGLIYAQVQSLSERSEDKAQIEAWFLRRAREQMLFWEEDATYGAKRGNLRAWATLGINLAGQLTQDQVALRWSSWSASFLQCQALADGSLPQEMKRGKYALHYQMHAITPLVVTTLLLEKQNLSILGACEHALRRIVHFALDDLEAGGVASAGYSGKTQSYFDGTRTLKPFELAWAVAYLQLYDDPKVEKIVTSLSTLSNSKLGGDQRLIWSAIGF